MSQPSRFRRLFQRTSPNDNDQAPKPSSNQKALGFVELSSGQDPIAEWVNPRILFANAYNSRIDISIVAIHGLDGHREQSWMAEDGTMWLKDLLPGDFPNARILSYGYDADTRSFAKTSAQTIFHHAEAFAEALSRQRTADPERPIIFLAHSLGGIMLKKVRSSSTKLGSMTDYLKALVHCHLRNHKSGHRLRSIVTSTVAVLFFGTPHSGANGVQLVEWMCRLLSIYRSTSNKVLKDLKKDSSALEELQANYLPASEGIDTIFFYEAYETPIVGGIVPRRSAIIAGDREANVVGLNADHCQIVKFSGRDDENYRTVTHYIRGFMEQGPTKIRENWVHENSHRAVAKGDLQTTQKTVAPKPLLSVSRNYVRRPEIDELLTQHLLPNSLVERQPRCILHGMGGGGKTQLALSWIEAHKHR
ncbi:hypothetical protein FRC17_010639 [Serendipita sp. 399]|nr:hypothetical protein FRC17_010639 [Serendipita sp. 399]